ncbi:WD40 repeat-containing protein [Artemisia annua]|uniref:WD40 repeat-containing protein n=1 Tax=Artemisia annua TaxID=35608 RepID=A0A2U1LG03_ARTAN|nr:WD40 repeat-containing protein [Artemisia annua]
MGGILLYSMLARNVFEGRDSKLAAIVTLGSSLDYTTSNSTLKLLLPLADPAQALSVPAVPLGALLAAAYPLAFRPPYVMSWLNRLITAQDMVHPELMEKAEDRVVIFDLQQRTVLGSLQTPFVKYIVWSNDMETVALLSKHAIVIASKKLDHRCNLHETIRVKGGAWDDNGVFIYTTLNHIKYCLPNGDNGIVKTLDVPV